MEVLHILPLIILAMVCFCGGGHCECDSPQFLEIGKIGIIECTFQDDFYAISWYTAEGFAKQTPLVRLVDGETIGEGFTSGEFDVREDGSLIINNVTLLHEGNFTAVTFQSKGQSFRLIAVELLVVVKPSSAFPVIDVCKNETICFTRLNQGVGISCFTANSRPAIHVHWVTRTIAGDVNISSQISITSNDGWLFTSRATTEDTFIHSSYLSLLVCKADGIPGMMMMDESAIFIENNEIDTQAMQPTVIYAERHSTLELSCSKGNITSVVWETADQNSDMFRVLSYAFFIDKGYFKTYDNYYILQSDGSLLMTELKTKNEGSYRCVFQNDTGGGTVSFEVIVYVTGTPVIQGCDHPQYCVLDVGIEGTVNCSVKGIRPKVQLRWKTFSERQTSLISFTDHQLTTTSKGEVYDVTLSSKYELKDTSTTGITIECSTLYDAIVLTSSAKVDLFFSSIQPTGETAPRFNKEILWILLIIALLCVLGILLCLIVILKAKGRERRMREEVQQGEDTPMISIPTSQAESNCDLKPIFKRELKTKYKYQYGAVQPIPYIRDRLYSVDRVFVEGGFEKLLSRDKIVGLGNWEKLKSYHEVTDMSSSSSRTIIEGDPGYGKSTLTLQLAYDWCNCTDASPLADVDILILLRLRQLGGVHSLCKAVKQFILPKDSRLTEEDVKTIIQQSRPTVIILDGFDEYPKEETESLTEVISMIRGEMFQESFVVLTTRTFFLPKSYPPQSHRIRLTGFDSKARDAYIRKAVTGDNTKAVEKIERSLQKNSVLQGLCQVPLFFVIFAHMTHESETFFKFSSVTSFFKYIIVCFHSHMKNKMKDANVKEFDLHENNHAFLDEIAFEGLSGKNQNIVWRKEDLVQRLGDDFYTQYRKIGILVEEEALDITYEPGDIEYNIQVSFYHKLFCEWYAAYYLCRKVVEPEADLPKLLENMNPFDLQYTYRFACGLNFEAGKKIIQYLRDLKDGDKFAVLCLLEQSGNFDQIKETVQELCSDCITIDNNDSLLLQSSIIHLLEIGSSNQIPISFVWLRSCFKAVDLSAGGILLKSELLVPPLPTLKELVIGERGRELTEQELSDVLEYSVMSSGLKSLRFCYLIMPKLISKKYLSVLDSRNIQVSWCTDDGDYLLSHQTGEWETCDQRLSNDVFEGDISAKTKVLISLTKEIYKEKTSAVPVIPSDHGRLYSVNDIYVEGGLQRFVVKGKDESSGEWESMDSYQNILTDGNVMCKRHILQGEPGFGKSMVALKMAYDWCNDLDHSSLTKVDLFLLVHFSLANASKSIYTEIRRWSLPKDSPLSYIDIRNILRDCSSAVMVLDGFNLCACGQTDDNSDVIQIIQGKFFKDIDVITTCTFVPTECVPGTARLRLTGFDERAREKYIRKVLPGDEVPTAHKSELRANPSIGELFNVPLFFTVFVHLSKKCKDLLAFDTVFACFTECWHSHMKNQGEGHKEGKPYQFEKDHLDKVAFDCLTNSACQFVLDKETVCQTIGKTCYVKYIRLGILRETGTLGDNDKIQSTPREAQFHHNLFCKWFAAYYVATHATRGKPEPIKNILTNLKKCDVELIVKFVGKLNVRALGTVLCWVRHMYDFDELSKLILEHFNLYQTDSIVDIVREFCSRAIEFNIGEKALLQEARSHLLHMASKEKISIPSVSLRNCYSTVSGGNHLQLKSDRSLPVLTTLKELTIREEGREITGEEFAFILQYSSKCLALKELRLSYCMLPQSVQPESVSVLRSRNAKVSWDTPNGAWCQLNLESCVWKPFFGGEEMTDEAYQEEVRKFIQRYRRSSFWDGDALACLS